MRKNFGSFVVGIVLALGSFTSACDNGPCTYDSPVSPSCNPNQPDKPPPQNPPQDQYEALPARHTLTETDDSFSPGSETPMWAELQSVTPLRGSFITPPGCPAQCFQYLLTLAMKIVNNPWTTASILAYFSRDGINFNPDVGGPDYLVGTGVQTGTSATFGDNGLLKPFPPYVPKYLIVTGRYTKEGVGKVKGRTVFELDYRP